MRSIENKLIRNYRDTGTNFIELLSDQSNRVDQLIKTIKSLPIFLKDPTLITPLFSAKMILLSKVEQGHSERDAQQQLERMYQAADDVQGFLETPLEELGGQTILQALEAAITNDFEEKSRAKQASTVIYN